MSGTIGNDKSYSDVELANQLDAEDRLRNRGYTKTECPSCRGAGWGRNPWNRNIPCSMCDGRGYFWQAPLTKTTTEQKGDQQ
jgi:DnaJ-class molecular chaperone